MNGVIMQTALALRKITRRLYPYRGLSRVADLFRKAYMRVDGQWLIPDFDGDLSFHCALNEHISSQLFWRGYYSGDQLQLLRTILKPGMVFLDAGANKGEFTVFAAKYLVDGKVLAFEPVGPVYEALRSNVAVNGFSHVRAIRKGLGNTTAQRPVFNTEKAPGKEWNLGTYTLYPRPGVDHPEGMMEIIRLDDFVKEEQVGRIDVMKIDIEGGELEMLRGAEETIVRCKPVIFIEVNQLACQAAGYDQREILRFLEAHGYQCSLIGRGGKTRAFRERDLKAFQNLICRPV